MGKPQGAGYLPHQTSNPPPFSHISQSTTSGHQTMDLLSQMRVNSSPHKAPLQDPPSFYHLVTSKPVHPPKAIQEAWPHTMKSHPSIKALDEANLSNEAYASGYSNLYPHEMMTTGAGRQMRNVLRDHLSRSSNKSPKDQEEVLMHLARFRKHVSDKNDLERKRKRRMSGEEFPKRAKQKAKSDFEVEQDAIAFAEKMKLANVNPKDLTPQELEVATRNMYALYGGDKRKAGQEMLKYMKVMDMDKEGIKLAKLARPIHNRTVVTDRINGKVKENRNRKKEKDFLEQEQLKKERPSGSSTTVDFSGRPHPVEPISPSLPAVHHEEQASRNYSSFHHPVDPLYQEVSQVVAGSRSKSSADSFSSHHRVPSSPPLSPKRESKSKALQEEEEEWQSLLSEPKD